MAGSAVDPVLFGPLHSYQLANTPRRLLYTFRYYDFAAGLIGPGTRTLDIGCGEGVGTWLIAKACGEACGVDFDADAIAVAQANWARPGLGDGAAPSERGPTQGPRVSYHCVDFLAWQAPAFDAAVNFDVIEHIMPANADAFIAGMARKLKPHGLAVVGTPSLHSAQYANAVTNAGHVNLYTGERLCQEMARHFDQVFLFSANDEVIHTGFLPLSHYLIAVACNPKAA